MDLSKQPRCPGNDMSTWTPDAIGTVPCPSCGAPVEIWKDEPMRFCPSCKTPVRNPKLAPNCEKWCSLSENCPGVVERKDVETADSTPDQSVDRKTMESDKNDPGDVQG